ncbi:MAG: YqgE/AlgH family protein [Pseudomonadota bacterium]
MHKSSAIVALIVLLLAGVVSLVTGSPHRPSPESFTADLQAPAAGRFLVASRKLHDSHFGKTVIYLLQHGRDGSIGLIVNRPLSVTLGEALPNLELTHLDTHRLRYGGPVSKRNVIMLLRDIEASWQAMHIQDGIYASNNLKLLQHLNGMDKSADELQLFVGHAGWRSGQLQRELRRSDWHVTDADTGALFAGDTTGLWQRLIDRLDPQGVYVRHTPGRPDTAGL